MRQFQKYMQRWKKAWVSQHSMLLISSLFVIWAGFRYEISKMGVVSGLAVLFFAFFFNEFLEKKKCCVDLSKAVQLRGDGDHRFLQFRLGDMAKSFRKLSRMMGEGAEEPFEWSEDEKSRAFSEVTEKMCAECGRREHCWEKEYYDTCHSAYTLVSAYADHGHIDKNQVPSGFRHRCIHMDQFLNETRQVLLAAGNHRVWKNRFRENRLAFAGQMGEVAALIEELSLELSERKEDTVRLADQIVQKHRFGQFKVKKCMVSNEDPMGRRQKIYLMVSARGRQKLRSRELAQWVSEIAGQRFVIENDMPDYIGKSYEMIELVEDTKYRVVPGVARYTKDGENVSGDSYAVFHLDSGQAVFTLSDGMGSGEKARNDSEWMIELLEQMVDTGFGRRSALRMINSMLMFQDSREMFSSIDMTVVDLYNGMCDFIKAGAASTFIKRGEKVECVTSGSLPMGVFPEMDCENVSRNLFDGDMLIMVTDGVVHHFPKGNDSLCELISKMNITSPSGMAAGVLNEALNQVSGVPEDDMTVLVCAVCKKSASVI